MARKAVLFAEVGRDANDKFAKCFFSLKSQYWNWLRRPELKSPINVTWHHIRWSPLKGFLFLFLFNLSYYLLKKSHWSCLYCLNSRSLQTNIQSQKQLGARELTGLSQAINPINHPPLKPSSKSDMIKQEGKACACVGRGGIGIGLGWGFLWEQIDSRGKRFQGAWLWDEIAWCGPVSGEQ